LVISRDGLSAISTFVGIEASKDLAVEDVPNVRPASSTSSPPLEELYSSLWRSKECSRLSMEL